MARSSRSKRSFNKPNKKGDHVRPGDGGAFDPRQSRIKSLNQWDEADMRDDQDEFYAGTDKVFLEHDTPHQLSEGDLEIPEQLLDVESDDDVYDDEAAAGVSEDGEGEGPSRKQRQRKVPSDNSQKGRFGKRVASPSLSLPDGSDATTGSFRENPGDDSQPASSDAGSEAESSGDDERWSSYHVLNKKTKKRKKPRTPEEIAADAESRALELEEAKRLHLKARSNLTESDFSSYLSYASPDELLVGDSGAVGGVANKGRVAPQTATVPEFDSEPSAIAYLLKTKPEALALVSDFRRCLKAFAEVDASVFAAEDSSPREEKSEFAHAFGRLQYHVLATYLSTSAFYIHMALKVPPADQLVVNEVTKSLLELRTTISLMEQVGLLGDLKVDGKPSVDASSPDEFRDPLANDVEMQQELRDLLFDQSSVTAEDNNDNGRGAARKRKAQDTSGKAPEPLKIHIKTQKKVHRNRANLDEGGKVDDPNEFLASLPPRPSPVTLDAGRLDTTASLGSDFVEPLILTQDEVTEKAKRKKELRFYTAKIDAKGKRREKATRGINHGGVGGDADLPYMSKEAQRREFLRKQDHSQPCSDEMSDASDIGDGTADSEHRLNQEFQEGDYYNTIKELKESAKSAKKMKYDESKMVARDSLLAESEPTGSGPREITRHMQKNKGLTPKRARENRNPRVKKRLRFDKANKKLSTQLPTYKAEKAAKSRELNGYSGEKSGIKAGVVKSRKL